MKIRVIVILIAFLFVFSSNVWAGLHPGTDVDLIHENEETGGGGNTTPGSSSGSSSKSEAQKYLEELKKKHEGTAKQALKKRGEGLFGDGWYTSNDRTVIHFSATQKTTWSDTKIKYYRWQYKSFQASPEAIQQGKNPSGKMQYPPGRQERKIGATWTSPTRRITVRLFDDGTYKFTSLPYGDKITYETYTIRATIIYSDTYPSLVGEGWTYTSTIEKGRKHDQPIGREETHIAEGPGDVTFDPDTLQTTSQAIFSRQWIYTNDLLDGYTDKPFELEVIYELTANTTLKKALPPVHVITRYKNLGTMDIIPVNWDAAFLNNNKTVRIWAKFKYPKAAVPGKSPMIFRVQANTKTGIVTISDRIDVPVNTLNLRFTNLPEEERGEFYPIQGLQKLSNKAYLKDFGTVNRAGIHVK